jgi:predicted double-glycine peptidase
MLIKTVLLLLLLALTTGPVSAERPVRSLLEFRQENLIVQQWDNSCGAAALATILTYHLNYPVTEKQVVQGMLRETDPRRVQSRGGFSLLDMQRYAASAGFDSDGYTGMTIEDVADHLPMIVPIKARGYDHFVVVRSIDTKGVSIGDPGFGNYIMKHSEFLRVWPGIGFEIRTRTRG